MSNHLKVMIVDDMTTYRMILARVVQSISHVSVIGSAPNGKVALEKLAELPADIVLLDVEMPEMDGLETLVKIRELHPNIGVVMVSGVNLHSADITIKALSAGALEFIPKPTHTDQDKNTDELHQNLTRVFQLYREKRQPSQPELGRLCSSSLHTHDKNSLSSPLSSSPFPKEQPSALERLKALPVKRGTYPSRIDAVVIAISTGGPGALNEMVPQLPADLGVPILIVQHMPPLFTASLASNLDRKSKLRVKEASQGEAVLPDTIYIAPGGHHMIVQKEDNSLEKLVKIIINDDPPENSCRPSADPLFRSAVSVYGSNLLVVVMTGMGSDGALGVKAIKDAGGCCISQSAASCTIYGMPKAIDDMGLSNESVDLQDLANRITALVQLGRGIKTWTQ